MASTARAKALTAGVQKAHWLDLADRANAMLEPRR